MREVDVKDGLLIRGFVLGYRRPDLIYYFKSSGYMSRSRPVLVGRAPSVHVPLPHQTLCLDIAPPLLAYIRVIRPIHRPAPFNFIRDVCRNIGCNRLWSAIFVTLPKGKATAPLRGFTGLGCCFTLLYFCKIYLFTLLCVTL